ncbi:MAG: ADOP family duplicated permease [Gemmatimonadota bacterium]|nr:ADOP family duplicated permease [Gemmatimonadota bacterium]
MRHAAVTLRRRPGFALLAVLTLGAGIGASVSVYSVAHWVLLRPVSGVEDPDRLVRVSLETETGNSTTFSLLNLQDLVASAPAISRGAGSIATILQVSTGTRGSARSIPTEIVTGDYFKTLGVEAHFGRLLRRDEAEGTVAPRAAVIGYGLSTSLFDGQAGALGETIHVNGLQFTIVGVAPPGFHGTDRLTPVDLWLGAAAYPALRRFPPSSDLHLGNRGARFFSLMVGRLAPGAGLEEAQEQLQSGMLRLIQAYPDENGIHEEYRPRAIRGLGADAQTREALSTSLYRLSGMVLFILIIACANVANLLVLRGIHRRGEVAVRRALGASRGHMLLQSLSESLMLALPAAGVGVALALYLNRLLWTSGFLFTGSLEEVPLHGSAVLFAVALSVATTVIFGTIPGVAATKVKVGEQLKGTAQTVTSGGWLLKSGLTVLQLSASIAILASALLLARSMAHLSSVDIGFEARGLHQYVFDPAPQGYDRDEVVDLHRQALERVTALPSVAAATGSVHPPFSDVVTRYSIGPTGEEGAREMVHVDWIAENFFDVLRIPVIEGRAFQREEVISGELEPEVAVIGHRVARTLFGDAPAVGRTFALQTSSGSFTPTIVGVVNDVRGFDVRDDAEPKIYLPLLSGRGDPIKILVRSPFPPEQIGDEVRFAVGFVEPRVPVEGPVSMTERLDRQLAEQRTLLRLVGLLSVFAVGLSVVGIYTIVAYSVTVRRREFGIRMALGAGRRRILASVLRRALALGAVGAGVGLGLTFMSSRLIRAVLFGVGPADPISVLGAAGIMLLVVLLATALPAVSATRTDPSAPIRAE